MSTAKWIGGSFVAIVAVSLLLSGCDSAATTANDNLSKAADNFEVPRRIVGINGTVERTSLGLSDNVTWVSTQLAGVKVSFIQPRVIFAPGNVIPNVDLRLSTN